MNTIEKEQPEPFEAGERVRCITPFHDHMEMGEEFEVISCIKGWVAIENGFCDPDINGNRGGYWHRRFERIDA